MVAVRNRDLAEDSKSTLGFAYQGNQQLLSFSLDTYSGGVNEYGKIKSFNLLGRTESTSEALRNRRVASHQLPEGVQT